jgi:hypothetical protein
MKLMNQVIISKELLFFSEDELMITGLKAAESRGFNNEMNSGLNTQPSTLNPQP